MAPSGIVAAATNTTINSSSSSTPNSTLSQLGGFCLFTFLTAGTICVIVFALAAWLLLRHSIKNAFETTTPCPKFHDVWVTFGGERWIEMMPVSAKHCLPTHTPSSEAYIPGHGRQSLPSFPIHNAHGYRSRETSSTHPWLMPRAAGIPEETLEISVLVLLPSPDRSRNSLTAITNDKHELPNMYLGVTRLPYRKSRAQ